MDLYNQVVKVLSGIDELNRYNGLDLNTCIPAWHVTVAGSILDGRITKQLVAISFYPGPKTVGQDAVKVEMRLAAGMQLIYDALVASSCGLPQQFARMPAGHPRDWDEKFVKAELIVRQP